MPTPLTVSETLKYGYEEKPQSHLAKYVSDCLR